MLHNEMKGRVHVDQDTVWTQLKVDNVDADLVKACCQQLEITCKSDIDGLKKIVDPNTRRPEPEMYPFLVRFSFLLAELNLYLRIIGHNIPISFRISPFRLPVQSMHQSAVLSDLRKCNSTTKRIHT